MHQLEEKISKNIAQHGLLHDDACVVVALSGGADSVALLAILCALQYRCVVAHCNFHLRGDESNRELIPKMSMFTLPVSCLTTSNLP